MSLLIKALDKAQAQSAKVKQAQTIEADKRAIEKPLNDVAASAANQLISSKLTLDLSEIQRSNDLTNQTTLSLSLNPKSIQPLPESAQLPTQPYDKQINKQTSNKISNKALTNNQAAANVFAAKHAIPESNNKRLAIIVGTGLVAMILMAGYLYQFIDTTPLLPMLKRPAMASNMAPVVIANNKKTMPENTAPITIESVNVPAAPKPQALSIAKLEANALEAQISALQKVAKLDKKQKKQTNLSLANDEVLMDAADDASIANTNTMDNAQDALIENDTHTFLDDKSDEKNASGNAFDNALAEVKLPGKARKTRIKNSSNAVIASESASINVTKTKSQNSINPILMSAYAAYNANDDVPALKLYKQVLQRDIHNVDALLGLGAIAQRQGRTADANSWYGKVLEVEPKNSIAMMAVLNKQTQTDTAQIDAISAESRIKNMLVKQPNDANLQAALGNVYADQKQWVAAQQAYFEAYRINSSADNALNLAVSLDQMGKPALALPYYLRALEQNDASSNIDKAAIEARVKQIK